jgi:hypothetical protein
MSLFVHLIDLRLNTQIKQLADITGPKLFCVAEITVLHHLYKVTDQDKILLPFLCPSTPSIENL